MIGQFASNTEDRRFLAQSLIGGGIGAAMIVAMPIAGGLVSEQNHNYAWTLRAKASLAPDYLTQAKDSRGRIAPIAVKLSEFTELAPSPVLDFKATQPLKTFTMQHIRQADLQHREFECMARAIYYEARSENRRGQKAVAEVVINRTRSPYYPASICGVVYQGAHRVTGCQFTFTCDGSERDAPKGRAWQNAQRIAAHAMMGLSRPLTDEATHYHASYVDPYWAPGLLKTERIGRHIFYRSPYHGDLPREPSMRLNLRQGREA
jgi:spore germination cell wall hydrolase CwlJ-like protein